MLFLSFSLQSSQVLSDPRWGVGVVCKLSLYLCDSVVFQAEVLERIRIIGLWNWDQSRDVLRLFALEVLKQGCRSAFEPWKGSSQVL